MTDREVPRLDARRADDFRGELTERAHAWVRDWNIDESGGGFGAALIDVAARFSAQVAERLDRAGEKLSLGLLDWLALRGKAARPARMPVAFKLADNATDAVLAPHPVRLQADVDGASVVFETESDVKLVPGRLELLVGVDPVHDSYFLPPGGLSSLAPLEPSPDRWTLKNFANAGDTRLQLDPALGLAPDVLIEMDGSQYLVKSVEGDLVTIEPGIQSTAGLAPRSEATRVTSFDVFGKARNWQTHEIYLGDNDALDIEAPATIEITNAAVLIDAKFEYWGKSALKPDADADWVEMALADQQRPGSVVLTKPAGSIESRKIGDSAANRWIRARQANIDGEEALLDVEELKLIINHDASDKPCPDDGTPTESLPQAEGFTNAIPLVLTSLFYPMGREPKQFDAFSLGCADAFSKKSAKVSICFELADPSVNSFGVLRSGILANRFVAGVGQDSALHLYLVNGASGTITKFRDRDPLQPPRPRANSMVAEGAPIALTKKPPWRPAVWTASSAGFFTQSIFTGVSAHATVWVWKESIFHPESSGWISFGPVNANVATDASLDGLVHLVAPATLFALLNGALFTHGADEGTLSTPWAAVPLREGGAALVGKLSSIAPVCSRVAGGVWSGNSADGLVGVVVNGGNRNVYFIAANGTCRRVPHTNGAIATTVPVAGKVDVGMGVTAVRVFWHESDSPAVVAAVEVRSDGTVTPAAAPLRPPASAQLASAEIKGESLELAPATLTGAAANVTLVVSAAAADQSWLLSWTPFDGAPVPTYSESMAPEDVGPFGGAPVVLDRFVVVPGTQADAWISPWNPELRISDSATLEIGLVTDSLSLLSPNDFVLIDAGAAPVEAARVGGYVASLNGKFLFSLVTSNGIARFGVSDDPHLRAFRSVVPGTGQNGEKKSTTELILEPGDNITATGDWLTVVDGNSGNRVFCRVTRDPLGPNPDVATLAPNPHLPGAINDPIEYFRGVTLAAQIAPYFSLSAATTAKLTVTDLTAASFAFNGLVPNAQVGDPFSISAGGHPSRIVLRHNWMTGPTTANPVSFLLDATTAAWTRQLRETSTNPELIWEYWNGTSWAKLKLDVDETSNLKSTGRLKFTVPPTLASTEVSGKSNHWIRARLIGGDYGREKVTVVTATNANGSTEQTVKRDASGFHPPLVVAMRIRYALEEAKFPEAVLTVDSGSLRDQSNANRTPGASIEAFVPLALLTKRLQGRGELPPVSSASAAIASTCDCTTQRALVQTAVKGTGAAAASVAAPDGPSLLLGFDASLVGESINLLLLVEERSHDDFAPLAVHALGKDRFEPLTVRDTTRALGENGLLSMSFPVKPSPRELFGRSLSWIRLRPSRTSANIDWKPVIRGAYLNAAWATAAETLTREPLGSSDGRPKLTVQVARPPLLQDTLELRVREPLDDEERQQLVDQDGASVKSNEPDLKGDWVLWRQVPDSDDAGPRERVYSLDEQSGEIQFGDGLHGMIPPIGRDAVVAFSYRRAEPAADGGESVPANKVTARTALQLITPVESVEAAFAADRAAGGSPPEADERVLRFGNARLRHRERALSPSDFEDLALQSSPDIAQARAFRSAQGLKLVVVMRGPQPAPHAAQRRELKRLLQSAATPLLGGHDAVTIVAPHVRRLRLRLALRVASLDDAGRLGADAKQSLVRLFDTATGGVSASGWPLGVAPTEEDVAFALESAPDLAGIDQIEMVEIDAQGNELPWRSEWRADELVMLADDALRIHFEPLELPI
ncbi:hypothetical protein QTI17_31355 [Variovorax sp. J31P179]|uniref:hypothetical protein n=1 Tax=Variovorax sp. J31P179 TaxID=3053508 RepID=UPI002576F292|nr:hypothetical protein [Variovorax sp. J31P179]MDM0085093.1 hypothetical protein [Variovorax sp. J31P179]